MLPSSLFGMAALAATHAVVAAARKLGGCVVWLALCLMEPPDTTTRPPDPENTKQAVKTY